MLDECKVPQTRDEQAGLGIDDALLPSRHQGHQDALCVRLTPLRAKRASCLVSALIENLLVIRCFL